MTEEDVAIKLRLLLHFRGSGNASDKEYQVLNDVNSSEFDYRILKLRKIVSDYGDEQRECQLHARAIITEVQRHFRKMHVERIFTAMRYFISTD